MTMKKIFSLILVLGMFLSSCGTANYVNGTDVDVYGAESIPYVLSNYYPGLYEYYTQGLIIMSSTSSSSITTTHTRREWKSSRNSTLNSTKCT